MAFLYHRAANALYPSPPGEQQSSLASTGGREGGRKEGEKGKQEES